ncbi:MAG TPA: PfkB family carbohydrate kinase [Spirochaetota bacterium]|nr:PfkB family carbohydrate kinase [Spirochaetota bacterium]HOM37582.1 PfkB family carbohydrate kinase [Spirochaetota bacterium]HPQ49447.1 PfkB family carbohydrate kinase [Spirochaetota bacterium]
MKDIVAVGSIAYDSIRTPFGEVRNTLGGSLTHFVNAASKLSPKIGIIGVVGGDFKDISFFIDRSVDITDVQVKKEDKTFYWEGYYEELDNAISLKTELNSFASFKPIISDSNKKTKILFLANIDPDIQFEVMNTVSYSLCFLDTMNFWIEGKKNSLNKVLSKASGIILNEGELYLLTEKKNISESIKLIFDKGIKYIVLKRGGSGVMFFSSFGDIVNYPSFFVQYPKDPTGAGDSFAGGFLSYLVKNCDFNSGKIDIDCFKNSIVYANILASFNIEGFGVKGIENITLEDIKKRYVTYLNYSLIPKIF